MTVEHSVSVWFKEPQYIIEAQPALVFPGLQAGCMAAEPHAKPIPALQLCGIASIVQFVDCGRVHARRRSVQHDHSQFVVANLPALEQTIELVRRVFRKRSRSWHGRERGCDIARAAPMSLWRAG